MFDINAGVEEFRNTPGALLVDVRNPDEFANGHIPGSINIRLQQIEDIDEVAMDADVPIFLYCLSGARSVQAEAMLRSMDYTQVTNIGGINAYTGELEY